MKLLWGFMTPQHIITIILALMMPFLLYLLLRHKSRKTQTTVMFVLSLFGFAVQIYNMIRWHAPLQYLPLHLCCINAMLLPFAIITRNRHLCNLMPIFSIGSISAIIFNTIQANFALFSYSFMMYYIMHMFEFALPILFIALGHYKFTVKNVPSTVIIMFSMYTAVHFVNVILNNYFAANGVKDYLGNAVRVNYMFTIYHENNPALKVFWDICPHQYFYLLFVLPIIVLLYLLINAKEVYGIIKSHIAKKKG